MNIKIGEGEEEQAAEEALEDINLDLRHVHILPVAVERVITLVLKVLWGTEEEKGNKKTKQGMVQLITERTKRQM